MQLTERQKEILRRVVEEYVATGQPVGSKTLVEKAQVTASASKARELKSEDRRDHRSEVRKVRVVDRLRSGARRPRRRSGEGRLALV